MYRGFLRFRLFLSEDNGILSGKAAQRVFLHLNANIRNALICGSRELTLCCRSNFQPVASGQSDLLPIDNGFALPCNNTVDLFIVPSGRVISQSTSVFWLPFRRKRICCSSPIKIRSFIFFLSSVRTNKILSKHGSCRIN